MKTHDNYSLRGGLKMTKVRSTKGKSIKAHPVNALLIEEGREQIALEGAARIYRESVMHGPENSSQHDEALKSHTDTLLIPDPASSAMERD